METLIAFIGGLIVGGVALYLVLRGRILDAATRGRQEAETAALTERAALNEQLAALKAQIAVLTERVAQREAEQTELRDRLVAEKRELEVFRLRVEQLTAEKADAIKQLATLATTLEAERAQSVEKIALLNETKEQLRIQFENLANQIFEEKGQKFAKQNQANLETLLTPLNEKIKAFQDQVAQTYDKESKERLTLKNEIERLAKLNAQISSDAVNLTQALKGSSKTQGTWGEMVLERILESSGLTKGREYQVQENFAGEEGGRFRPDVVVHLPDEKHLIIDSKVSLVAYERYCSAESDADKASAQREHLNSVRAHIKGLSEKNYQDLHGLNSLDFVLLFFPIEPAFMLASTTDSDLFTDAFSKNVLLVSPSTLLATMRTIASIWRYEHQSQNAQAIAAQCAKLYDKFVGFVEDLEDVGKRLEQAQKSYDGAHGKLVSGRGNLIRQAEGIKALGVKPNKQMPRGLEILDDVEDDEDS